MLFVLLWAATSREPPQPFLLDIALGLFVVTALTDMLDGVIARRYGLVTVFGRIADPFADKVLVVGCFIFLLALPQSPIQPWMVVVIISREFLVSGLRGFIEGQGGKFGAILWGKLKVTSQYSLIAWVLFASAHLSDVSLAQHITRAAVIGIVVFTILSGIAYLVRAIRIFKSGVYE